MYIRKKLYLSFLISLFLVFGGCTQPLEVTSDEVTIDLSAGTDYSEILITVPGDANKNGTQIEAASLVYSIQNLGSASTNVNLYLSLSQPPTDVASRTLLFGTTLGANETKQGEFTPALLIQAIRNQKFTLGIKRTGASSSIKLTAKVKIKGTVALIVL